MHWIRELVLCSEPRTPSVVDGSRETTVLPRVVDEVAGRRATIVRCKISRSSRVLFRGHTGGRSATMIEFAYLHEVR